MIALKVTEICLGIAYLIIQAYVAKTMSTREMYRGFIKGQCVVGMIFANIFYAPAWALKVLRAIVLGVVK